MSFEEEDRFWRDFVFFSHLDDNQICGTAAENSDIRSKTEQSSEQQQQKIIKFDIFDSFKIYIYIIQS